MAFNPKIRYNPSLSVEENLTAIVNWLNFSLQEMTVGRVPQNKEEMEHTAEVVIAQLGGQNTAQAAEQQRKALQMFAASLTDEQAMEIATVYDPWVVGKHYKGGEYFTHGTNAVGDPQLYKVNEGKEHTSQADWLPGTAATASLYTAIGLDESGHPVWSQPTGAHDAYNTGDIVNHNGTLYISNIDGNTTVPGTDDRWWSVYNEEV